MKIIGTYIACVSNLCDITCISAGDVNRNRFIGAHSDLDVRNIHINVNVENTSVVISVDPQIAAWITSDLREELC